MEFVALVGLGLVVWWWLRQNQSLKFVTAIKAYLSSFIEQRAAQWVPAGQSFTIGGLEITGGMIYVGEAFSRHDDLRTDPSLINPRWGLPPLQLPPTTRKPLPNHPSYSAIKPSERAGYLHWLASNRDDPNADVGFVLMYFAGIERRLFVDNATDEIVTLMGEVLRLRQVYGRHELVNLYAHDFVDAALFVAGQLPTEPTFPIGEIKLRQRLSRVDTAALGVRFALQTPLTWDWALTWFLHCAETQYSPSRLPTERCFDEFKALFRARFEAEFPNGIPLKEPACPTIFKTFYSSGSNSWSMPLRSPHDPIFDPHVVANDGGVIAALGQRVTQDLRDYSVRLRNPDARDTLAAQLLLPNDMPLVPGTPLHGLKAFVLHHVNRHSEPIVSLAELMQVMRLPNGRKKPTAATLNLISDALAACHCGMEPDRRTGAKSIERTASIALFSAVDGERVDGDRQPYAMMRLLVQLSAIAITADGTVSAQELNIVSYEIEQQARVLNLVERQRLNRLLQALTHGPQTSASGLMRQLSELSEPDRQLIGDVLISIVVADGYVDETELNLLKKFYKALNLPMQQLHDDLATLRGDLAAETGPDDELVRILHADKAVGHAIPAPPEARRPPSPPVPAATKPAPLATDPAPNRLQLDPKRLTDPERLDKKRAEMARSQELLAKIFETQNDETVTEPSNRTPSDSPLKNLDEPHARLVMALVEAGNDGINRQAFDDLCRHASLFPDGAIETINLWAIEALEAPLIENTDPIVIFPHMVDELNTLT